MRRIDLEMQGRSRETVVSNFFLADPNILKETDDFREQLYGVE